MNESSDFGPYSEHSLAYCFSFVFVTPESDYLQEEEKYQRRISRLTCGDHFVHVGNLVRAEEPYEGLLRESRADLFGTLLFFYLHSGLNCARFRVRKDGIDSNDGVELSIRISIELGKWISRHLEYLPPLTKSSFSTITVSRIWCGPFPPASRRTVLPSGYPRKSRRCAPCCRSRICFATSNCCNTRSRRDTSLTATLRSSALRGK